MQRAASCSAGVRGQVSKAQCKASRSLSSSTRILLWPTRGWPCSGFPSGIRYNRAPTGLRPGQERGIEGIGNPAELGIAGSALAFANAHADHDWGAAKAGYLRAIELAPSHATAWQWLGLANAANGEQKDALSNAQAALKIDPLSLIISVDVGRHMYYEGAYQGAIDQFLKTLELDPGFVRTHYELARAYAQWESLTRRYRRRGVRSISPDVATVPWLRLPGSALMGDETASRQILAELLDPKEAALHVVLPSGSRLCRSWGGGCRHG